MLLLYRRELPQTLGINVKEKNLPIEQKKKKRSVPKNKTDFSYERERWISHIPFSQLHLISWVGCNVYLEMEYVVSFDSA